MRYLKAAFFPQDEKSILGNRRLERRALVLPVGNQLVQRARVDDRPGEDVRADFRALFERADREVGGALLEAQGGGEAGGTSVDDHHVVLHRFARQDRKSTRLNSSHGYISYAVFCLKKK